MYAVLLALALTTSAGAAEVSAPLQAVLAHRHLDETALRSLGYVLDGDAAHELSPDGKVLGPALTPDELEKRLAALERGDIPVLPALAPPAVRRPASLAALELPPSVIGLLYDGSNGSAGALAVLPAQQPATKAPYAEPAFDATWSAVEAGFRDPKTRSRALKELSARFVKDPDSVTGLGPDSADALRLLAREIHEGRGGPAAAVELKRELTLAANIKDPQKFEFAAQVVSPLAVFVALSRSRSTHSLDSRLYFESMVRSLEAQGRTVSGFLAEQDPNGRQSADFLLRAHAYDALVPYLERRPAEAEAIAPLLFPAGRASDVRAHADALEGLLLQLAVKGRAGGAAARFTKGLIAYALTAPPDQARRIAVYLKLNEEILPRSVRPTLAALDPLLPPGVLDDAGLTPSEARGAWPTDQWTFTLHFASTGVYHGWVSRFQARGWILDDSGVDPVLEQDFGALHVSLVAKLYQGDEEDFLRGKEASRFLASVTKDLRDPSIQGVILRTHAQFRISNLFDKKVTSGKLLLDGACRSAWDLRELRRRCPTCQFIVNTGTGRGKLNNDAVIAVIEGLANDMDWDQIGSDFARTSPSTSARIQGPWTPPYAEALRVLEAREKADLKAAAAKS